MTARLVGPRAFATGALAGLMAGAVLVSCHDATGPHGAGLAPLAVAPLLPSEAAVAEFGLAIDRVRIVVVRPPSDTIAETSAAFPADQDVLDLSVRVPLVAARESLSVTIEALAGAVPLFRGTRLVEVRTGLTAPPPVEIPVTTYVGPGAGVDSLVVQPRAPFIYLNDSLRLQVQAFQGGAPVTQFYVAWSSSDSGVARINSFGVLRAPALRGGVYVRARTPSGAIDSVPVTFVPLPTQVLIAGGDGQSGLVDQPLEVALEVEVRGSDDLPVGGVNVRFRSLAGGGPADQTVVSAADGRAGAIATLGSIAGTQSFEASLPAFSGVPTVTFGATGLAGQISAVKSLVTVSAGTIASGSDVTVTLDGRDANGNDVTTGGATVVFAPSGGTSTGSIGATTDHGDGSYTATFTGVLAGTAATIGATVDSQTVTTALPTIGVVPGAISAATSLVTVGGANVISGDATPLTLQGKDAAGNTVTAGAATVTFTASGGTSTGIIGTTTDHANGTYSAPFTGVSVGTATTIGALIDDVAVTSTPLPTITVIAGAIDSIAVTPATALLDALDATQQLAAEAFDANGNPVAATFTWASSDTLIASVDGAGLATALANGAVTISATADGVSGAASLSISQVVTSVAVTPDSVLLSSLNATQQFTAAAFDRLGNALSPQPAFAWSSSDPIAAVDGSGLATALANGGVTIAAATGGLADSAKLDIAQVATQLAFLVEPSDVIAGDAITPAVEVAALDSGGSVATNFAASVTLVRNDLIDCGSVLSGTSTVAAVNGVATFADLFIIQTCSGIRLAAQSGSLPSVQSAPLTVSAGPVATVTLSPAADTLHSLNDTTQFVAQAADEFGNAITDATFVWTSGNTAVAAVTQSGRATALANGLATIVATSGGVADTAQLTVQQIATQLIFQVQPSDVIAGDTITPLVQVAALDSGGSLATNFAGSVTLVRNDLIDCGSVLSGTTMVNAVNGVATFGDLAIVEACVGIQVSGQSSGLPDVQSAPFSVLAGPVATVMISPLADTLHSLRDTTRFVAQAADEFGNVISGAKFVWTSGNTVVAKVSQGGLATALANGLAPIVATSGGVADTADLTVQQVVASVVVTPTPVLLTTLNQTLQLTAEALDAGGSPVTGVTFTWASDNPTVASVDPTGLVTALIDGIANVSATIGTLSGVSRVTVSLLAPATRLVFIQEPPSPVFFGEPFTVQVAAQDDAGNTVTGFTGDVVLGESPLSTNSLSKLQGTLTQPLVKGVATFTGLVVDGTDTTAIDASAGSLTGASNPFQVVNQIMLQETGPAPYFAGVDTLKNLVFVSNTDVTAGGSVTVLDGDAHKPVNSIADLRNPGWEGVNAATQQVFVADSAQGLVYVIDEFGVIDSIAVGPGAAQPAVNSRGDTIYVPAQGAEGLSLFVIAMDKRAVVGAVLIGSRSDTAAGTVWDERTGWVWVAVPTQGAVIAVDPATSELQPVTVGEGPYGIALDPNLNQLYVSLSNQNAVAVIDPQTRQPLQTVSVGAFPQGLSVDLETGRVFVANRDEGTISVIDGIQLREIVTPRIAVGRGPGDAEWNPRNRLVYVPNGNDNSISIVKPN